MGKVLYLITGAIIIGIGAFLYLGLNWSLEVIATKLGVLAALVTSATIVWKKAIAPLLNKATDYFDKISSMIKDVEEIRREIKPNGGSSIKDAVNRIEARLINMEHVQSALRQDGPMGIFQCKTDGRNIDVNRTYCRLLKCTKEELLDFGWKNFISEESRESYEIDWKDAFEDGREISATLNFVSRDGEIINTDVRCYPITDISGEVVQYLGILTPNKNIIHRIN